jgi:hypothetical protein
MCLIIQSLYNVLHAQEEVRFFNIFKGIPICYRGEIVEIGKKTVRFHVHPHQITCMKIERHTHIESNLLPQTVRAEVLSLDIKSAHAMLGHFEYDRLEMQDHSGVNVKPHTAIKLAIDCQEEELLAELKEISLQGLVAYLKPPLHLRKRLVPEQQLCMRLALPLPTGETHQLNLSGNLQGLLDLEDKNRLRLDIQLNPDEASVLGLSRYIHRRQKEILNELRRMTELNLSKSQKNPTHLETPK